MSASYYRGDMPLLEPIMGPSAPQATPSTWGPVLLVAGLLGSLCVYTTTPVSTYLPMVSAQGTAVPRAVAVAPKTNPGLAPLSQFAPRSALGPVEVSASQSAAFPSVDRDQLQAEPTTASPPHLAFVVLAVGFGLASGLTAASSSPSSTVKGVKGLGKRVLRSTRLYAGEDEPSKPRRVIDPDDMITLREDTGRPGFRLTPDVPNRGKPIVKDKPMPKAEVSAEWRSDGDDKNGELAEEEEEETDLNGVEPGWCFVGSAFATFCSCVAWYSLQQFALWIYAHPIDPDWIYPVQRLETFLQQAGVAGLALASGIFGFTGLGMFALGVRVTYGRLTGELDPANAKPRPPPKERK